MRATGRVILAAGALLAAPPIAWADPLTVSDRLSFGQQEETIAVYIGGALAGTLHVDTAHPNDSFTVPIEGPGSLTYAMCGRLLKRTADGGTSSHLIDNGGTIDAAPGHTLVAITQGDRLFLLQDADTGAQATVSAGPACAAAIS